MSDIKLLLEEYSLLTGRPMATITVDEYLSFKKFESKNIISASDDKFLEISHTENKASGKETVSSKENGNIKPITSAVQKKAESRVNTEEKEQVNNKDAILAMLRSIPG